MFIVVLAWAWPNRLDTVRTSCLLAIRRVADVCPYGIITTNRESPELPTVFGILRPDSSSFSNPKNQAE